MSENVPAVLNIYQRLAAASQSISTIVKSGLIVSEKRTYTVATSSDILMPVRNALNNNGIAFTSKIKSWSTETKEVTNTYGQKKTQIWLTMTLEYTLINKDKPEEIISVDWPIVCSDDGGEVHKLFGKALTYAQKYFFNQFFIIPRDDFDPDLDKGDKKNKKTNTQPCDDDDPDLDKGDKKNRKTPQQPSDTRNNATSTPKPPTSNSSEHQTPNGNATPKTPPVNGNGNAAPKTVPMPANIDGYEQQKIIEYRNEISNYMKEHHLGQIDVQVAAKEAGLTKTSSEMYSGELSKVLEALKRKQAAIKAADAKDNAPLTEEEKNTPAPGINEPLAPFTPPETPPAKDKKK